MDATRIKIILALVFAMFFALYLGIAVATAQMTAVAWVAGGVFLFVCLLLGKHVWILIPATLSLRGGLNFLPGSIAPWHIMTAVAAGFFLLRVAIRRQSLAIKWTWIETTLLLVGLTIAQAFVRAPVGVMALGGDVAGGKPYFIFAAAFLAYLVISMSAPDFKAWRWAVILYIAFGVLDGVIMALSQVSANFAMFMLPIYSNVSYAQAMGIGTELDLSEMRFGYIASLGALLGLVACTFWRPLAAVDLRRPWRAVVAGFACVAVLISGFRGATVRLFVDFIVGSAVRRKWLDVALVCMAGFMLVVLLAASGLTRMLPFGAQRALSPLPIDVDPRARMQAQGSAEDRFEMWRLAMGTDRFIESKLLGDGFSLKASEVRAMTDSTMPGSRFRGLGFVERSMAMGSYHGFHVETIRFTGVAGLLAATAALVVLAVYAWRCIQAFRDHPHWGYVLFICMPYLIHPLWYWLIFGSYRAGYPELIAMAGMIKLLLRAIPVPAPVVNSTSAAWAGQQLPRVPAPAFVDAAR